MTEVVPILVRIGLKPNGHALYPDWTQLPMQATHGIPHETHQIEKWVYDKSCGHTDDEPGGKFDSPRGTQLGVMLVTERFSEEALAMWPVEVSVLSEKDLEEFWNYRGCVHLTEKDMDVEVLQGLKVERDLLVDMKMTTDDVDQRIRSALDDNDPSRGVRKSKRRHWKEFKHHAKVTIKV